MSEELFAYFGYGSLVNKQTLRTDYVSIAPARLQGWRRFWQSRENATLGNSGGEAVLLSIYPHDHTVIDGALVIDRRVHLPALDERETGYSRHLLQRDKLELLSQNSEFDIPEQIYVYVANLLPEIGREPLLQSYLDAVMSGFYNEHGEEGLARFLTTTDGFGRPIIADRKKPIYPRAVEISIQMASWFDELLHQHGVEFASPQD